MNVAFDDWIPVVTTDGKPRLASLCSVLTEGDSYADLAVRPHERVALMRLFLCVAHAALDGPKDYDEWITVPQRLPDAARKYLETWQDHFELFHPTRPWLQVAELTGDKTSPVSLLDFELATGNNSTLNDHEGQLANRPVMSARIALTLLTFQNFSSGGGSPIAQWKQVKTSQVGNPDAPCLSQSMAHALIRGKRLSETIHFNLPTRDAIAKKYKSSLLRKKDKVNRVWEQIEFNDVALGRPVWELFPPAPDPALPEVFNATRTYLGRLVPVSRWVRLLNNIEMFCCNGFRYDTFKDGFPAEPTASVYLKRKRDDNGVETVERAVVSANPSKAIWRELSALMVKRSAFGVGGPLAIENAPYDTEFDFQVCAMTRDQASMDIAIESVFHVSPAFYGNMEAYKAEVQFAESLSRKLGWGIESYRKEIDGGWDGRVKSAGKDVGKLKTKLHSIATSHYWTSVEKNLGLLMAHIEAIGTDNAISSQQEWRRMLFKSVCDAYRLACGQETPRQIRAFAKGWQKLTSTKDETEPDTTATEEGDQ